MAISTYGVQLMVQKTGDTYEKLVDIKAFPDMGGAPEMLETTTLSDAAQTFIKGIQTLAAMEFTYNYTKEDFATVKALDDGANHKFALYFGANGVDGKFEWEGQLSTWVVGAAAKAVVEAKISIAPSTKITVAATE